MSTAIKEDEAMADGEAGVIRRELMIEASPETVFAFFTEPAKMARWMGVSHKLDPRPGGVYEVNVDGTNVALGEFKEVVPHSRIVYTWGWKGDGIPLPPGASTITVELAPKNGGTALTFTHSGLPEPMVPPHTEGWEHYCARLVIAAAGGDPGPDSKVKKAA